MGEGGAADRRESEETGTAASGASEGGRPCPTCERPMDHRHCKYVCPVHGVVFDCADTFY